MNYIVLDLEATCEENNRNFSNEIIEIGAVRIDENFDIISTYNEFIKPKINPVLTDFCKQLTTITQEDVDNARAFPEVIEHFMNWADINSGEYLLCSWGYYDRKQLVKNCELYRLDSSWIDKHISLKHQFGTIRNERPCGMAKALNKLNIPLEGTHHRGIDDAKNIAKIFLAYKDKWDFNQVS
ncbi:MAG TPA: exonuclease domain-containing protein [Mogibacterium sp.]|nr:exonuclease domain-containing protein [Mogibacterium sp.]